MTVQPLRTVADVRISNVDKKSVEGEQAVRLCNYTDVYYNRRLDASREYMGATATTAQIASFRLQPGDTVITKDSETAADIGASSYIVEAPPDLLCGYHLALVRPGRQVDSRYLSWQLGSAYVREQLAFRATGVTRFGLTYEAIRGVSVYVPPVLEQQRVADFLDDQVARLDAAADDARHREKLGREAAHVALLAAYGANPTPECWRGGALSVSCRCVAS